MPSEGELEEAEVAEDEEEAEEEETDEEAEAELVDRGRCSEPENLQKNGMVNRSLSATRTDADQYLPNRPRGASGKGVVGTSCGEDATADDNDDAGEEDVVP